MIFFLFDLSDLNSIFKPVLSVEARTLLLHVEVEEKTSKRCALFVLSSTATNHFVFDWLPQKIIPRISVELIASRLAVRQCTGYEIQWR